MSCSDGAGLTAVLVCFCGAAIFLFLTRLLCNACSGRSGIATDLVVLICALCNACSNSSTAGAVDGAVVAAPPPQQQQPADNLAWSSFFLRHVA